MDVAAYTCGTAFAMSVLKVLWQPRSLVIVVPVFSGTTVLSHIEVLEEVKMWEKLFGVGGFFEPHNSVLCAVPL